MSMHNSSGSHYGKDWDPDAALASLALEGAVMDMTPRQMAQKVQGDNVIGAMQKIVHLALYSTNDNVSARCAMYLVDRELGPVNATSAGTSSGSASSLSGQSLEEFLSDVMKVT